MSETERARVSEQSSVRVTTLPADEVMVMNALLRGQRVHWEEPERGGGRSRGGAGGE